MSFFDPAIHSEMPLDQLMQIACEIRDGSFANTITYSPKVFIPLTMLCRDRCGYCTFAKPPARLDSAYLALDEVLEIARDGAKQGCSEALLTLGERPELRYPAARQWLEAHGYSSTVQYLADVCRAITTETSLLAHANAGALNAQELCELRAVSVSQGMMLETLAEVAAHKGSPDKTAQRRLETLELAGVHQIPFTTGLLVGIGETKSDRIEALCAIKQAHERHGHVQEVIVQNFIPKPGTSMHMHPVCPEHEHLETIALARLILPEDIAVQAPPNLASSTSALIKAGVNDLGGISPVTIDHVNPHRAWPNIDKLASELESDGFELVARLAAHPRYIRAKERWIDPDLHAVTISHADSHLLKRESDGGWYSGAAIAPPSLVSYETHKHLEIRNATAPQSQAAASGAVVASDYSCATVPKSVEIPPALSESPSAQIKPPTALSTDIQAILRAIIEGHRVEHSDIVTLFSARGKDFQAVCETADHLRCVTNGERVSFVSNRNINYTNVCTFKCSFCGFSKSPRSLQMRETPYLLPIEEITRRAVEARDLGATEVCLQGGIHPSFDGDYYLEVLAAIHEAAPTLHIHGFTALEVFEGARRSKLDLKQYLARLKAAGLRSLPGTAAEILVDEARAVICPDKINTAEWLQVHETAHEVGLGSNVTIMFGTVEAPEHWATHLLRTRDLGEKTGGFSEFVPLPFVHMASPIFLKGQSRKGPTFRESVLMHAVGRIAYHGVIPNIQASWVKLGFAAMAQLLNAGCNDLGGTLIDESISRSAGADHGQVASVEDFRTVVQPLGRDLVQRNTKYDIIKTDI